MAFPHFLPDPIEKDSMDLLMLDILVNQHDLPRAWLLP